MEKKYIGTLPKGVNPKTKGKTDGNMGIVFELKEDGFYYGNNGKWTKEQITHDINEGYLRAIL